MIHTLNFKLKQFSHLMVALPVIGLAACSNSSTPSASLTMNSVSLFADTTANHNSAIAVDLVIVYSNELLSTFNQMSAASYFASIKQLLLDNPTLLDVWHWELVPGQSVQNFQPPQNKGEAYGAFVFANYMTPGDHRLRVTPDGTVNLLLLKDDIKNLSSLSANDLQTGTTMSMPSCGDSTGGTPSQGTTTAESLCDTNSSQGVFNLGPVSPVTQPCRLVAPPQPCAVQAPCTVAVSPPVSAPVPIVRRDLPPFMKPMSSSSAPGNSKNR